MTSDGPSNAAEQKDAVRRKMLSRLAGMPADEAGRASVVICDSLITLLQDGNMVGDGVVLSFAPIRRGTAVDEVDLSTLHHELIRRGRLALPRLDWENRAMEAVRLPRAPALDETSALEVRRHGVPEPAIGEAVAPGSLCAILVPGLAFDRRGGRLGRGGGFYDRYLERLGSARAPTLIGVCFEAQVTDRVPMESHDRTVDLVVTERSLLKCER